MVWYGLLVMVEWLVEESMSSFATFIQSTKAIKTPSLLWRGSNRYFEPSTNSGSNRQIVISKTS